MWLSQQLKPQSTDTDADLGQVTITGRQTGVLARGEVRSLPVYGPGGYIWQPASGESVLVIKGGPGGEESCVTGVKQSASTGMSAGEVKVYSSSGATIYLKSNGSIELHGQSISVNAGTLTVNGTLAVKGTLKINGLTCPACGLV